MALSFRGFVRAKLYPNPSPEKLILAEEEDAPAVNPNQEPESEFLKKYF
jgi:hypothetical protein